MENLFTTESRVLSLANAVLTEAGSEKVLTSTNQINSLVFSELFNKLPAHQPTTTNTLTLLSTNEGIRCQTIINSLEKLLPPEVSLTHIKGYQLAKGDLMSIKNLLEIFGLLLGVSCTTDTSTDDSNVITDKGFEVINEILKEELSVHIPTGSSSDLAPPTSHTSPICQSTPHRGAKSRLTDDIKIQDIPQLSISTVSTTTVTTPEQHQQSYIEMHELPKKQSDKDQSMEDRKEEKCDNEDKEYTREEIDSRDDSDNNGSVSSESDEEQNVDSPLRDKEIDKTNKGRILNTLYKNYTKRNHHTLKKPLKAGSSTKGKYQNTHRFTTNSQGYVNRESLIKAVKKSFPEAYISPATERHLRSQQICQVKPTLLHSLVTPAEMKIIEMQTKQKTLVNLLQKDLKYHQRMHSLSIKKQQEKAVQLAIQHQRRITAKSRRYFNEYELAIRNKLQKKRTKEEQIFKEAFKQCLKLLKDNKRELEQYTKEKQRLELQRHQEYLESLQTFYHNQLAMIAEAIDKDQKETTAKESARKKEAMQKQRELHNLMESGIKELWSGLDDWEECNIHFRDCDRQLMQASLGKSLNRIPVGKNSRLHPRNIN